MFDNETIRETYVDGGHIRGICGNNPIYSVFKGIPYAAPPVGELRWKAPQPVVPWEGVRDCVKYGPIAEQVIRYQEPLYGKEFFQYTEPRSEDCLYLNVWTPAKTKEDKLPVFFWIHGGGFFGGSGSEPEFDGEAYCRRGIVFVSINYRLGAIGYLAHPELREENPLHISGNYGLQDQIAAFNWVRRNIVQFGGDPDRVTIGGQSAGAVSVMCLMTSPICRNELSGAIIQSAADAGTLKLTATASMEEAEQHGIEFMKSFGCSSIKELRAIPASKLVAGQTLAMSGFLFSPVVDGYILKEQIGKAILHGFHPNIPYICGNMLDEGGMEQEPIDLFNKERKVMLTATASFCQNQYRLGRKNTYVYSFSRALPGDDMGAFHAGELWYEFETLHRCWRPFNGKDYELSVQMADYFANFIRTGDPNGYGLPTWEEYVPQEPKCLDLGENIQMINALLTEESQIMLDQYFKKYSETGADGQ